MPEPISYKTPYTFSSTIDLAQRISQVIPAGEKSAPSLHQTTLNHPQQTVSQHSSGIFETLISLSRQVGGLFDGISSLAKSDKAQGKSLLQGLNEFQTLFSGTLKILGAQGSAAPSGDANLLGQSGSLAIHDQIGSAAQKYMQGLVSAEALVQLSNSVGFDLTGLSNSDFAELAYQYVMGEDLTATLGALQLDAGEELASVISGGSLAAKVVGGLGAAYSAYTLIDNWGEIPLAQGVVQGASTGAYIGSMIVPGIGTAIGGVIGGVVGAIQSLTGSGKSEDQLARDSVRDLLQKAGVIDENWSLTLADGSKYDIGKDGKHRYTNLDGSTRLAHEVDPSNPLTADTIPLANALAEVITGGNEKLKVAFSAYFTNAALSNAQDLTQARKNLLSIFASFKLPPENLLANLGALSQSGQITNQELEVYHAHIAMMLQAVPENTVQVAA